MKATGDINEMIAKAIVENMDEAEGRFSVEVETDDNTLVEVSGWCEVDGYFEDDYFGGTGAWATTFARVSVDNLTVTAWDDEGDEVEAGITPDIAEIERAAERMAE